MENPRTIIYYCYFVFFLNLFSQNINKPNLIVLSNFKNKINYNDSSLYVIFKVNNNAYFTGKHGVLISIPDSGAATTLNNYHQHELLMWIRSIIRTKTILNCIHLKDKNIIYFFTNDGIVYKVDLINHTFKSKKINEIHNKAIYHAVLLDDSKILLCGGNQKVSKGKMALPKGFVAILDTSFNHFKILWKKLSRFVWHLNIHNQSSIIFTSFNGFNSTLYVLNPNDSTITKIKKLKGLVYKTISSDNKILFLGSRSFNYKKNGMLGIINLDSTKYDFKYIFSRTGCLWDIEYSENYYYLSSNNGDILKISKKNLLNNNFIDYDIWNINLKIPIYDIYFSNNKLYFAGSKKIIGIIEL